MGRPLAILLLALIALGLFALMWRGWRRQVRRTAEGLDHTVTPLSASPTLTVAGVYVSSTSAGRWLSRIAADGLGVRSPVLAKVASDGVTLERTGAPDVAIPVAALRGARRENGIAGKVTGGGRVVVIRWLDGEVDLDTGIKPRYQADGDRLIAAINDITPIPATAGHSEDGA